MKTTIHVATGLAIVVLTTAGCKSTDVFQGLTRRDRDKSATFAEDVPPSKSGSRSQASLASNSSIASSPEQAISTGQQEIAAWYQDNSPIHLQTAQKHFQDAVQKLPNSADAHHGLAIVADLQKRYPDAERHYRQALAIAPQNSQILGDLGYSYLLQNRLPEAEQALNQSLGYDPANANATKHLGDVYARQGKRQLAESMYARVLTEADAASALAENAAAAQSLNTELAGNTSDAEKDKSLLSRLRPKKESEPDLTAEIRKQMEDANRAELQRRQQSQLANQQPQGVPGESGYPWAGNPQQGTYGQMNRADSEAIRLQQELARIESESYSRVPRGPIVLENPRTGSPTQIPAAGNASEGWPNSGNYGQQVNAQGPPGSMIPAPGGDAAIQQYQHQQQYAQAPAATPGQSGSVGRPDWAADIVTMAPQRNPTGSDPVTRPWGEVGPAAARDVHQSVGQAYIEYPAPQAPNSFPPQDTQSPYYPESQRNTGGAPAAGQGAYPAAQGQPVNRDLQAYEEAARAAARLGMGLQAGPPQGNSLPVTSWSSAGANSSWNGNDFGSPNRMLPTDAPPRDLNRAYGPQAGENMAPPPGTHGQFPSVTPPLRGQEQFGTASRYQAEGYQNSYNSTAPQTPSLQQYDEQRQRADADLNGAMQRAWNRPADQYVTPTAGLGNSRSVNTPPPWPHSPANAGSYEASPSQQQYGQGSYGQDQRSPNDQGGVVVPRSYPGNMNRGSGPAGHQNYQPPVWASQGTQTSGYRGAPQGYGDRSQGAPPTQGANLPLIIPTR